MSENILVPVCTSELIIGDETSECPCPGSCYGSQYRDGSSLSDPRNEGKRVWLYCMLFNTAAYGTLELLEKPS